MLGSPENCLLQASQIPSTGTFLTRFTIRNLRLGMRQVSHSPGRMHRPADFKRTTIPIGRCLRDALVAKCDRWLARVRRRIVEAAA
jgi:hypothetical protein